MRQFIANGVTGQFEYEQQQASPVQSQLQKWRQDIRQNISDFKTAIVNVQSGRPAFEHIQCKETPLPMPVLNFEKKQLTVNKKQAPKPFNSGAGGPDNVLPLPVTI